MEKQQKQASQNTMEETQLKIMCMGNNYFAPCTSPFNLKLQTYLRMTGIEYEVVSCVMSSSKGKVPFVEFKGQHIEDVNNIINRLNVELGKNLNIGLSPEEVEKTFEFQKMIEESLHWSLEYQRWFLDADIAKTFPLPNWFFKFIFKALICCKLRPEVQQELNKRNLGNCSAEELIQLGEKVLTALSQYLGENPFFMGKEPTEIDATVFGFLGLLLNGMESSACGKFVHERLPNLVGYVERMKEKYWPDWNEQCSPRVGQNQGHCKSSQYKQSHCSKAVNTAA